MMKISHLICAILEGHLYTGWFKPCGSNDTEENVCKLCGKRIVRKVDYYSDTTYEENTATTEDVHGIFKKHQCYTNEGSTKKTVCQRCGNDKFYVGQDDYYTTVVCTKCKSEECIHDG